VVQNTGDWKPGAPEQPRSTRTRLILLFSHMRLHFQNMAFVLHRLMPHHLVSCGSTEIIILSSESDSDETEKLPFTIYCHFKSNYFHSYIRLSHIHFLCRVLVIRNYDKVLLYAFH